MFIFPLKRSAFLGCLSFILFSFGCKQNTVLPNSGREVSALNQLVDPFLGTGGHGHTYPGATLPFGMVQLSPDNGTEGWDWSSGYHYSDSTIVGFSHTHLSGTGIGDYLDISMMPFYGDSTTKNTSGNFSHAQEKASPGYYEVTMKNGLKVALTATKRVGVHQYTFHKDSVQNIAIDLGFAVNWDKPTQTEITFENDTLITGYRKSTGWAKNQQVYFAATFNRPLKNYVYKNDTTANKLKTMAAGRRVLGKFSFEQSKDPLLIKVGISSASSKGALNNIIAEAPDYNFEQYVKKAGNTWENELSKIRAELITPEMDTIFYSALYHAQLAPNAYSDQDDNYKAVNGTIQKAEGFTRYTVFSLWDTFRAAHPLFSIIQPEKNDEFLKSMMSFYEESGLLPVWALAGNETNTMTGYHAIPVLTDAILKGNYTEPYVAKIYEAMLSSAGQDIRGTHYYREYGYIPSDKDGWSVSKTLEYAFDDWCIAQVAKRLNKTDDYRKFMKRSQSYKTLFDNESLFMRGKDSNGDWNKPFDPFYSEHGFDGMYIEGTAWQHSWFVPHDVPGLIASFGSEKSFVKHLDSIFTVTSKMTGENVSEDISGLIGQYAHGNEPSHHIPYLYNYVGKPWKSQEKVRRIMTELYNTGVAGLAGNDDCGQMSAWYIFSALGFYPVNPADGVYVIGSPLIKNATIDVGKGKKFQITAENNSLQNKYIQEVYLNGQRCQQSYISHYDIMQGGTLKFVMGAQPNKVWASQPESMPAFID